MKGESQVAPPPLKKINVSNLFAKQDDEQNGMNRKFSLIRAEREPVAVLGKRTSSIVSKDWNPAPMKTPFFKDLQLNGSFNQEKEAPNTANFNQIDFSRQFEMFTRKEEKIEDQSPSIEAKIEEAPSEAEDEVQS